jgi:serine/tyrosine/threonine adenylyltransferase
MKINFNNTYLDLGEKFYSKTKPGSVKNPVLIIYNTKLAEELNIEKFSDENIAEYLSGNKILDGSEPIAQVYAGHQF